MGSLAHLKILDDAIEQRCVLSKLPRFIQERWLTLVDRWMFKDDDDEEVKVSDDYPPFALPVQKSSVSSFVTKTGTARKTATIDSSSTKLGRKCVLCQQQHTLEHCEKFKNMNLQERNECVKRHGLCLASFMWGHRRRDCRHKKQCDVCKRYHPTFLHDFAWARTMTPQVSTAVKPTANATTHCARCIDTGGNCFSPIMPVWLWHQDDPENMVMVFAILDNQSDACYVNTPTLATGWCR
jgi:hypothetical protein